MAARKRKGTKDKPWPTATRERIRASMLVKRLESHILGEVEMSASQVSAALGLLRKTLPDLAAQELHHKGSVENHILSLIRGLDMKQEQDDDTVH